MSDVLYEIYYAPQTPGGNPVFEVEQHVEFIGSARDRVGFMTAAKTSNYLGATKKVALKRDNPKADPFDPGNGPKQFPDLYLVPDAGNQAHFELLAGQGGGKEEYHLTCGSVDIDGQGNPIAGTFTPWAGTSLPFPT